MIDPVGAGPELREKIAEYKAILADVNLVYDIIREDLFELKKTAELAPTFSRVAQELRSQYLIGFAPAALDGKVHKLEVRVNRPGMTVRARRSYLAAADRS